MKIVNILLSILVLLLAAVSAVSAFLLYEKRSLLVDGWNEMAKTINATSTVLDSASGTNIAKSLSSKALSHENYAELNDNLAKFSSQVQKIHGQRNELSATIAKISDLMQISNAPSKTDLSSLSNFQSSSNDAISGMQTVKDRIDSTANEISRVADKLGTAISTDSLKSDGFRSELGKLATRVNYINKRINTFNGSVKQIAISSGAGSINLSDSSYQTSLIQTVNAVKKLKLDYTATTLQLRETKGALATANRAAGKKSQLIAEREKKIATLNKMLAAYTKSDDGQKKQALTPPWDDGSKEALEAVKGKVIDVNRKYGFVVVSLGSSTLVEQKYGNGIRRVNPEIKKDADMIVARGLNSDNGKFIGKIKLVKINENCSIANVLPGSLDTRHIRVGDSVYFSNETIAKLGK